MVKDENVVDENQSVCAERNNKGLFFHPREGMIDIDIQTTNNNIWNSFEIEISLPSAHTHRHKYSQKAQYP